MLDHLADEVDGVDHVALALVVLDEDNLGIPVGVARMIRYRAEPSDADLAVTVIDSWQGRGVATALLAELMRERPTGVTRIVTTVAADNTASLAMLRRLGEITVTPAGIDRLDVVVELTPTEPTTEGGVMTTEKHAISHPRRPHQAESVAHLFHDRVAATPDIEAYRFPTPEGWQSVTWAQAGETVTTLAAGLLALGLQPEDRVAIASSTRIEWIYADLAVTCAAAATTTVYPTTGAVDVGLILRDSGSRIAFAEDDAQVAKLRGLRADLPRARAPDHLRR